jgi:hypothetical protein
MSCDLKRNNADDDVNTQNSETAMVGAPCVIYAQNKTKESYSCLRHEALETRRVNRALNKSEGLTMPL